MLDIDEGVTVGGIKSSPVAVVGMACRFPGGADDPSAFWECLVDGRDMVSDIPTGRYEYSDYYEKASSNNPLSAGSMYCRQGGFLYHDIEAFDANHFGISPREVVEMDPQQRLLLEVTWEAIENAGYAPSALDGSPTGVFFGMGSAEYLKNTLFNGNPERINSYTGTGNTTSVAAGRVSYHLGLQGPSIAIDTACSSSLVAIHLAMRSLQNRESELALAGGVNVMVAPELSIFLCSIGALSRTDRCHTFDEKADGYVRGEGCGIVVLKRLEDAQRSGDNILAVLKGSAVNHDGRSAGLTVPNRASQARVINRALNDAGIQSEAVDYVEAHGTGTALGDPIEVNALVDVMCKGRGRDRPLIIGAVKTNVGHLEAAAGMAGLIKGIMCLQNEMIPPNLHFSKLNPHIDLSGIPFRFPSVCEPWPVSEKARILGLSSFGIGGTNAHVIIEEAPKKTNEVPEWNRTSHPLCLSANRPEALQNLAKNYVSCLSTGREFGLNDVTYTAHTGRNHFPHRLAVVGENRDDIIRHLSAYTDSEKDGNFQVGSLGYNRPPKVCFLFTGQGSQYFSMGKELYETQPVFRHELESCDKLLRKYIDQPLIKLLFSAEDDTGTILNETGYTQPALFSIEYSLCKLWQSWGVIPDMLLGHSVGEYVAACVAGVFGLQDALRLISTRGRLMQALPREGSMVSVAAGEAEVGELLVGLEGQVSIAAVNAPDSLVVSGGSSAVDEVISRVSKKGIKHQFLQVSHAFHSPLMEPMLGDFSEAASAVSYQSPIFPLITNLTGREAGPHELDESYWVEHVREAVRFRDGLERAVHLGCDVFIEMGPQPVLSGLGRRTVQDSSISWLPSMRRGRSDWSVLAESLAGFYTVGGEVDWSAFEKPYGGRVVPLPNYPFQREKFWISAPERNTYSPSQAPSTATKGFISNETHPLLGVEICTAGDEVVFEKHISPDSTSYLNDHRILEKVLVPATVFYEIALASAAEVAPEAAYRLTNVKINKPLVLAEKETTTLQTILRPTKDSNMGFAIYSMDVSSGAMKEGWLCHVSGELSSLSEDESSTPNASLDDFRKECSSRLPIIDHFYESIQLGGFDLGPSFQALRDIWVGQDHSLGYVKLPTGLEATSHPYLIHPVLLDACIWVWAAGLEETLGIPLMGESEIFLPAGVEELKVSPTNETDLWCYAGNFQQLGDEISGDLSVFDSAGRHVATIKKFYSKKTNRRSLLTALGGDTNGWLHALEWRPLAIENESRSLESENWLILRDQQGVGDALIKSVTEAGGQISLVEPLGRPIGNAKENVLQVDPKQPSDWKELLESWVQSPAKRRRIVFLWGLDVKSDQQTSPESLYEDQEWLCGSFLHLIQAVGGIDIKQLELNVVTRGTQALGKESGPLSPIQALLWGLGRTTNNEYADLPCKLIDIDCDINFECLERLFQELSAVDDENFQVAYRNRERYVARLVEYRQENKLEIPLGGLFKLEAKKRGMLDSLALTAADEAIPGPGEIKIAVRAMGLNFRDVLNALGMYPGDPGSLGGECAGEVIALGEGVDDFQLGQQVMCLAAGSFTAEVVVPAWWAMVIPAKISATQAATIPISFLTAYYGLNHLAQLKKGERILIHAGAGGLGMAAIQLAKVLGAEIYATAGSQEKRELLKKLGVNHVMDSRSLAFADEIHRLTDGKGVDVVLNSLTGDFITRSLDSLVLGGRFIEVGKVEILEEKFLEEKYPGISYHFFDLADIMRSPSPTLMNSMYNDLRLLFTNGDLNPLPLRTFPIQDAVEAFRYMQQAKHIGKIVLVPPTSIRDDATYIITGGAGALGLQVAKHFSDNGAGALLLIGRRKMSDELQDQISSMEEAGTRVLFLSADIVDSSSNEKIRDVLADGLPPVRGIVHAAGVLDDGMLAFHELSRFSPVLNPKVLGAWNLHVLSLEFRMDFFVFFSSAASIWGNPGQSNYAAANSFLDTLAYERRRQGLPAISINWSAWAGEGMAETVKDVGVASAQNGIDLIGAVDGLAIMDSLLARTPEQVMVMPINWQVFGSQVSQVNRSTFLSELVGGNQKAIGTDGDLLRIIEAAPTGEHLQILYERVEKLAINVLGLDQSIIIDPHQPLHDMGLDSLMAVELCSVLGNCVQQPLPNTLLFDYGTLNDLTEYLATILKLDKIDVEETASENESDTDDLLQQETAEMSDAELEKSLLDELKDAGY